MDPTTIIAIIIAVIITIALYWASSTANRLHRLHVRTDAARQSLQASLDRRAAVLAACEPQFTALAHSTESIPLQYETGTADFRGHCRSHGSHPGKHCGCGSPGTARTPVL